MWLTYISISSVGTNRIQAKRLLLYDRLDTMGVKWLYSGICSSI